MPSAHPTTSQWEAQQGLMSFSGNSMSIGCGKGEGLDDKPWICYNLNHSDPQ